MDAMERRKELLAEAGHGNAYVTGSAMYYYWVCSCGKSGQMTTAGRAAAGKDRHLTAAAKRLEREAS